MPAELHRLLRALGLVWHRLGPARAYVAAIAGAVAILATIGLLHLVSSEKPIDAAARNSSNTKPAASPANKPPPASPSPHTAIARISPGIQPSLTPAAPTAATPAQTAGKVQITKMEQTEKRGPRGETFVVATIGLASRADAETNNKVEIHVYFYDLTPDNEIRPTDAQVTYQWLTPVRDWSDPTPKFLEATYFQRSRGHRAFERLRYGGFVVRVFSGGKLQDEQSQPETLLALFRNNANEPVSRASPPADSQPPPAPATSIPPSPPAILNPPSSPEPRRSPDEGETLPYGKPIPGKPGFLYSPYDEKFIIDVRGFPPGTLVNDPNTNKPFRVP